MPAPAAAALIKGLLGAGARGAATGGVRAAAGNAAKGMAADAVKGGAKKGMKNFARNMTGKTSEDYKARVDGVNPETGEYLTPEERKARFKGFATAPTKPGSQKLLSGGPTQAVAALPPAEGVGNTDTGQEKVVNHLEKIQMYLEKLLIIEQKALSRLEDKILLTAREDERSSAEEEEESQEKTKTKKKKENSIVTGVKKKASGIFKFLMDLGMKFVGFKVLDWISKEENKEKIEKIVAFFQGVLGFITTVGKFIGTAFDFSIETIQKSIEGITFLAKKVQEFFSFEWLDIDVLLEPIQPIVDFFRITIPESMNSFIDSLAVVVQELDKLPQLFVGIVDKITNGFLGFLGLTPENTKDFPEPKEGETEAIPKVESEPVYNTDGGSSPSSSTDPDSGGNLPKMRRGGILSGRTHAQGGQVIEAEGGEYVMNRRAVAAIGRKNLDAINFGKYPAVGGGERENPRSMAASGGLIQKFAEGGSVHPLLTKMNDQNIKKANAPSGLCVTGSLNTMLKSGVPEPAATGNDVGNNPRGAISQLMQPPFNWKSMGGTKTTLDSPYGKVSPGIFSREKYLSLVKEGKVPSGALVFQTRHNTWNGTNYNSRGYDMAIAQKNGMSLWNGVPINDPLVYAGTKKVVVLTPDGKQNNGKPGEMTPNSESNAGKTGGATTNSSGSSTSTASVKLPEVDLSILKAIMMGAQPSGAKLDSIQDQNNELTAPSGGDADGSDQFIFKEGSPSFSTGFDENVMGGSELGDNVPPFFQAVFPFNL